MTIGAQTLTDVPARLGDMDKLGIDLQVVFPTLFLVALTDDVALEAALCRSYNNWMAEACGKAKERLKFSAVVPLRDVNESVREVRRAKEMGAVAVMTLGVVWNTELGNTRLFPLLRRGKPFGSPGLCPFWMGRARLDGSISDP